VVVRTHPGEVVGLVAPAPAARQQVMVLESAGLLAARHPAMWVTSFEEAFRPCRDRPSGADAGDEAAVVDELVVEDRFASQGIESLDRDRDAADFWRVPDGMLHGDGWSRSSGGDGVGVRRTHNDQCIRAAVRERLPRLALRRAHPFHEVLEDRLHERSVDVGKLPAHGQHPGVFAPPPPELPRLASCHRVHGGHPLLLASDPGEVGRVEPAPALGPLAVGLGCGDLDQRLELTPGQLAGARGGRDRWQVGQRS
jgi:hypothetical protein